jgi:hypothetical protein
MPNDHRFPPLTTKAAQVRPAMLGCWLLGAAVLTAWTLVVLFPVGSSLHVQATPHDSAFVMSNTGVQFAKGDRLISGKQRQRREGEAATKSTAVSSGERKIPMGCDAAFSRLVKFENFRARCVT